MLSYRCQSIDDAVRNSNRLLHWWLIVYEAHIDVLDPVDVTSRNESAIRSWNWLRQEGVGGVR